MRKDWKAELVCVARALVMLAASLALIAWPVAGTAQERARAEDAFEESVGGAEAALAGLEEQIAASEPVIEYITADKFDDAGKQEAASAALERAREISAARTSLSRPLNRTAASHPRRTRRGRH